MYSSTAAGEGEQGSLRNRKGNSQSPIRGSSSSPAAYNKYGNKFGAKDPISLREQAVHEEAFRNSWLCKVLRILPLPFLIFGLYHFYQRIENAPDHVKEYREQQKLLEQQRQLELEQLKLQKELQEQEQVQLEKEEREQQQQEEEKPIEQEQEEVDRDLLYKMGFTKQILRAGNGHKPTRGQQVTVHCTGYGKNNDLSQKFWSTKDPGQKPFTFAVGMGQVIKGWDESVIDMSIGEVAKIHCTPDYAYGAGGFPAWGIMPNSELIFEIEVLSYA